MSLKTLHYFVLLILPSIILGQQLNSTISNGMEKSGLIVDRKRENLEDSEVLKLNFQWYINYKSNLIYILGSNNFDTIQVSGHVHTEGTNMKSEWAPNFLEGIWHYQKDSMYTSKPNAFSKGFSKDQILIINRMIRQEIRNYMENQNYDYYDN